MKKRSLEEPVRKRPSVYFVDPAVDLTKIRVIENRKKVVIFYSLFTGYVICLSRRIQDEKLSK